MKVRIGLMPWQIEFLRDPHPIKVLISGRQAGKSHALQAGIAKVCGETPGRSAVILPVQSQATDFFKLTMSAPGFDSLLVPGERGTKLWPYPQMTFSSGHYCEWRSFEVPKRLRGGRWTGVVNIDEANDCDGEEVMKVIFPKISTTKAQILITSTITDQNWLWDLYLRGQQNDPVVKSWLHPTSDGYMFRGEAGQKRLRDLKSVTPPWVWDSEYLCIPGSDNSCAFPRLNSCLMDGPLPQRAQPGRRYLIGLDLGRNRDQTYAVCVDDDGLVVATLEFEFGSAAAPTHAEMAAGVDAFSRRWGNARVVVDCTGKGGRHDDGDSHVKEYEAVLEDRLEPFYWSANKNDANKSKIIGHLGIMMEQGKLRIPRSHRTLVAQLQGYRILSAKGSQSTFGPTKGSKVNDDAVAALAQAAWGMREDKDWFGDGDDESQGGPTGGLGAMW